MWDFLIGVGIMLALLVLAVFIMNVPAGFASRHVDERLSDNLYFRDFKSLKYERKKRRDWGSIIGDTVSWLIILLCLVALTYLIWNFELVSYKIGTWLFGMGTKGMLEKYPNKFVERKIDWKNVVRHAGILTYSAPAPDKCSEAERFDSDRYESTKVKVTILGDFVNSIGEHYSKEWFNGDTVGPKLSNAAKRCLFGWFLDGGRMAYWVIKGVCYAAVRHDLPKEEIDLLLEKVPTFIDKWVDIVPSERDGEYHYGRVHAYAVCSTCGKRRAQKYFDEDLRADRDGDILICTKCKKS